MSLFKLAFIIFISSVQSQDCSDINTAFPIDMDNTICHGLQNQPSAKTYDECAQLCCSQVGCEVFQFNPSSKACWMGGNDYCTYTTVGWQSRARIEPATSHIWPLPKSYKFTSTAMYSIDFDSFIMSSNTESDIIKNAINRYMSLTFPVKPEVVPTNNILNGLNIQVTNNDDTTLGLNMDESYTLNIPNPSNSSEILLKSNEIWGALRGLETISQLIILNYTERYYTCWGATIEDEPRFKHRGLLIDSSRHFQSVKSIKNTLVAMSYAKLNVLHWHIVDEQSFPFESLVYPKLWQRKGGSYTMYERFLQSSIKDIIQYAKNLGIRVIPEFDMPGHANSWCYGYPSICPSMTCQSPLNPANNFTWELLSGLINEISNLWIDDYIHLGGDEVNTDCWQSTPSIKQWMTDNNYTPTQALQYFDGNAIKLAVNNNKKSISWNECWTLFNSNGTGVINLNSSDSVIQVWYNNPSILQSVVKAGFQGIYAPDSPWYLDALGQSWETRYLIEPLNGITNEKEQEFVIGGEGCMWGETVDVSDIQQTIWPDMAAIAERLWSQRNINNTIFADPRLNYFRCKLNERNIASALVNPKSGQSRSPPPEPGSCYAEYERRRRFLGFR